MTPSTFDRKKLSTKRSAPNLGDRDEMERGITQEEIEEWACISNARPALPFNSGPNALKKNPRQNNEYLKLPDLYFVTDHPQDDGPSEVSEEYRPVIARFANKTKNAYKSLTNLRARANSQSQTPQTPHTPLFELPNFSNQSRTNFAPPTRANTALGSPQLSNASKTSLFNLANASRSNLGPAPAFYSMNPPTSPNPELARQQETEMVVLRRELCDVYEHQRRANEALQQERATRQKLESQLAEMMAKDKHNHEKIRRLELQIPFMQQENKEAMQWVADLSGQERRHARERDVFLKNLANLDKMTGDFRNSQSVLKDEIKSLRNTISQLEHQLLTNLIGQEKHHKRVNAEIEASFRATYNDLLDGYLRLFQHVDGSYLSPAILTQDRITHQNVKKMKGKPMPNLEDTVKLYKRHNETVERFEKDHLEMIRANYMDKATEIDLNLLELAGFDMAQNDTANHLLGLLPEISTDNAAYKAGIELIERYCMNTKPDTTEPDGRRKNLLVKSVLAFQEAVRLRRAMAESFNRGSFLRGEDSARIVVTDDGKIQVDEGLRAIEAALEGVKQSVAQNGILVHEDGTWTEVPVPEDIPVNTRCAVASGLSASGLAVASPSIQLHHGLGVSASAKPSAAGNHDSNIHPALRGLTGITAQRINSFESAQGSSVSLSGSTLRSSHNASRLPPSPGRVQVPRRTSSITALRTPLPQSPNASGTGLRAGKLASTEESSSEMSLLEMLVSPPLAAEDEVLAIDPSTAVEPKGASTPPKKLAIVNSEEMPIASPRPTHIPLVAAVSETLASPLLVNQPFPGALTPGLRQQPSFGSFGSGHGPSSQNVGLGILGLGSDFIKDTVPRSPNADHSVSSLRSKFSVRSKNSSGSGGTSNSVGRTARNSHSDSFGEDNNGGRRGSEASGGSRGISGAVDAIADSLKKRCGA